jgi:hypothetical protein
MTQFVNYSFPVTGGSTLRNMPGRLRDAQNVKDWGATGDGSTDDWDAVMDALEWNSVVLTASAASPGISAAAVQATLTGNRTADVVTALMIVNTGTEYTPGQSYNIVFSGGGGSGATGHAVANGSGGIGTAELVLDSGGSGYTSNPTGKIEYPGHITTLSFTSVTGVTTGAWKLIDVARTGIIHPYAQITSINTGANTITFRGWEDGTLPTIDWQTAVVLGAGINIGTQIRFVKPGIGKIFFPAGTYRVSKPIDLDGNSFNFRLSGVGRASKIVGNFNDYVITRGMKDSGGAQGDTRRIENLSVENEHLTGGGIRFGESVGGSIRNVDVTASKCISLYNQDYAVGSPPGPFGSFEICLENIKMSRGSGQRIGSFGLAACADGTYKNLIFTDFETGMMYACGQGGFMIQACHFELCSIGFRPGIMPSGDSGGSTFFLLQGCRFLNCSTAIYNVNGQCVIAGTTVHADAAGAPGGVNAQYGIRDIGSSLRVSVMGVSVTGTYSVAGINVGGSTNRSNMTLVSVNSVSWNAIAATNACIGKMRECNVAQVYGFANLPPDTTGSGGAPNRREGDIYNLSDCNTATLAAVAAGGGNNHVKVRVNQAHQYIVVGK